VKNSQFSKILKNSQSFSILFQSFIILTLNIVRWLKDSFKDNGIIVELSHILPSIRDNNGNAELSTSNKAQFAMRWVSGVERSLGWTLLTPGRAYRPIALVTAK